MRAWVVRAGADGESEDFALDNNVVVIGWDDLDYDRLPKEIQAELRLKQIWVIANDDA